MGSSSISRLQRLAAYGEDNEPPAFALAHEQHVPHAHHIKRLAKRQHSTLRRLRADGPHKLTDRAEDGAPVVTQLCDHHVIGRRTTTAGASARDRDASRRGGGGAFFFGDQTAFRVGMNAPVAARVLDGSPLGDAEPTTGP